MATTRGGLRLISLSVGGMLFVLALCAGCGGGGGSHGNDASVGEDLSAVMNTDGGAPVDLLASPMDGAFVEATITISGQATATAIDTTRNKLYVALAGAAGNNAGFQVIDTTSDTVTATIAAPVEDGKLNPFFALALDPTANLLYACDLNATSIVYVFDLTAGTLKSRFSIVGTGITAPWIGSLVVNPATSTLYVGAFETSDSSSKVAIINGTNDTLTAAVKLTDLPAGTNLLNGSLALDTTNHLLFACAKGNGKNVVDGIDTTSNAVTGTQQQLAGSSLGCQGGAGVAVDVTMTQTDGGMSSGGVFYSLEPSSAALPAGFIPTAYSLQGFLHDGTYNILVVGYDQKFCNPRYLYVRPPTTESGSPYVGNLLLPDDPMGDFTFTGTTSNGPTDIYVTGSTNSSCPRAGGSMPVPSVFHIHIPAAPM